METRLVRIAAVLLDTSAAKAGLVLYSINNFPTWLAIIEDLFLADPTLAEERSVWTKMTSKLRELNDIRVRLAHHTSDRTDVGALLSPSHLDTRTKTKKHDPLSADQVMDFSDDVLRIRTRLDHLLIALDLKLFPD